jgi:3',5'-cyclic AMP phosphodiesterase CpdA
VTRIAHLSDLHFGRDDPAAVAGLLTDLEGLRPDLVVVSGDLTQRARRAEFGAARRFLRSLPAPVVAVPGNHDIPLFDLPRRLAAPRARYLLAIDTVAARQHRDDEVAVLGLDTTRHLAWRSGAVPARELRRLADWAREQDGRLRIVVAHHPFAARPGGRHAPVRRAAATVRALAEAGVEVLLTGHQHTGWHGESATLVEGRQHALLVVEAGTATSRRRRGGEPNSYNLLDVERGLLRVAVRSWDGSAFHEVAAKPYLRSGVTLPGAPAAGPPP